MPDTDPVAARSPYAAESEAPMRLVIRVDGSPLIGGGHVMRCLTLADQLRQRGHDVHFVSVAGQGDMTPRIRAAGYDMTALPAAAPGTSTDGPPHQHFLTLGWQEDARLTGQVCTEWNPDWLIWDHYGLDARWVNLVRAASAPRLRVMVIDDLDDRPLGSDMALDQTRLAPSPQQFPVLAALAGPQYALLRPEFATLRPQALARRGAEMAHVLIAPGMADVAGLAPAALSALADFPNLSAEVVMGAASQSVAGVAALVAGNPRWRMTLDASDMAKRMVEADLCIGAGGTTTWERCCLGLPTVLVAVAQNQRGTIDAMAQAGAAETLGEKEWRQPGRLAEAIKAVQRKSGILSQNAAALVDGHGALRVAKALEGRLRRLTAADAQQLFNWRNRPHIRAMSLSQAPLDWQAHCDWVEHSVVRDDGLWLVYAEEGRDLGHVNARREGQDWTWGFYIGEDDAPKGAGRRMLAAFLRLLLARDDFASLSAVVRRGNAASEALHRGFGFREVDSADPDLLAFTLSRCDLTQRYAFTGTTKG